MEMSDNQCTRCRKFTIEKGYECRACHGVTLVMITVHKHWNLNELESLAKMLEARMIFDFIKDARANNKFLCHKLGNAIVAMAHPSQITPEQMKSKVCDAIRAYHDEISKAMDWEERNNQPGKYMQMFRETVGSWVRKVAS